MMECKTSRCTTSFAATLLLVSCGSAENAAEETAGATVSALETTSPVDEDHSAEFHMDARSSERVEFKPLVSGKAPFSYLRMRVTVEYPDVDSYSAHITLVATDWAKAKLVAIGRPVYSTYKTGTGKAGSEIDQFSTIGEAANYNPNALVVNSGLISGEGDRAGELAGLFMIDGKFAQPFNDRFSGILCIDRASDQAVIYKTENYKESVSKLQMDCVSAIQEYPVIVNSRKVAINETELQARSPQKRSILAISSSQKRFFVFAHDPIHLYAVADMLVNGDSERIKLDEVTGDEALLRYLGGARGAINLPGSSSAIAIMGKRKIIGDTREAVRAALIFEALQQE